MAKTYKPGVAAGAALLIVMAIAVIGWQDAKPAEGASGTIRVNPATQTVPTLMTNFDVTLIQNSSVATGGAQTDFTFDRVTFELMSVALGSAYTDPEPDGALVMGIGGQTPAQAIAEANTTGTLQNVGAFFLGPPGQVPAGDGNFVVITLRGKICGRSALTLSDMEMVEPNGTAVTPVTGTNGEAISVSAVDFNAPFGVKDWTTPAGDDDCDGYTTTRENFLGTDPTVRCAASVTPNNEPPPDRWPVDFNDSRNANTIDVGFYVPRLGTSPPNPNYAPRYDLNQNNIINTVDVGQFVPLLGKVCG